MIKKEYENILNNFCKLTDNNPSERISFYLIQGLYSNIDWEKWSENPDPVLDELLIKLKEINNTISDFDWWKA